MTKPGYYWGRPAGSDHEWQLYRFDGDADPIELVEGGRWPTRLSGDLDLSHEVAGPPGTVHVTVHAGGVEQPLVGLEQAISATARRWLAEKTDALPKGQQWEVRMVVST